MHICPSQCSSHSSLSLLQLNGTTKSMLTQKKTKENKRKQKKTKENKRKQDERRIKKKKKANLNDVLHVGSSETMVSFQYILTFKNNQQTNEEKQAKEKDEERRRGEKKGEIIYHKRYSRLFPGNTHTRSVFGALARGHPPSSQ